MRKKINLLRLTATFIIMLVLSLVLIACGGGTQNNEADVQSVLQAKEALSIGFIGNDNEDHVIYDVSLIESGIMGVSITWESSDTDVISVAGVVTRPSVDTTVTLTATLTKGDAFDTKEFDLVVIGTAEDDLLAALETL